MKKRNTKKKSVALLSVLLVVVLATAGMTLAILIDKTNDVYNTFIPSEVTCEVDETFNDGDKEKTDVRIKNTGDTDAFIRATFVVTWQKTEGGKTYIAPEVPVLGADYEIVLNTDENDDWFKMGDYYYYKNRVAAENPSDNDITSVLIESCKVKTAGPEGYTLSVEIIADAIQADGIKSGAVENKNQPAEIAWGVLVINDNGKAVSIADPATVQ